MSKLTAKMRAVAIDTVFADASCSMGDILQNNGVDSKAFASWLENAEFREYLTNLVKNTATAEKARIMKTLSEASEKGDPKAVRLYFDLVSELGDTEDNALEEVKFDIWGGEEV